MNDGAAVELVYLHDCPHWRRAAARLGDALRMAGRDPSVVRYRRVVTADAPASFPGSPTVLIDGRDPFPNDVPGGPTCRRYPTEAGPDVAPSLDQLVQVLSG